MLDQVLYKTKYNVKVWILAKKDLSARVVDSFLVIGLTFATRIMCWQAIACEWFKVVKQ
jgi:hypothetical protein